MTSYQYHQRRLSRRCANYLLLLLTFSVLWVAIHGACLYYLKRQKLLPPTPLTKNPSLNAKLAMINENRRDHVDVLGVGSSMTLNNIHSKQLVAGLPFGATYLNVGIWELKMADMEKMTPLFLDRYRPGLVVMGLGPMDFQGAPVSYSDETFERVEHSLASGISLFDFVQVYDLGYYAKALLKGKYAADGYQSLHFDRWGGVLLNIVATERLASRWEKQIEPDYFHPQSYERFERIAAFMERNKIGLLCAQPPLRQASIREPMIPALQNHWKRVEQILARHGHRWVNTHPMLNLGDEFFVDYSHLNEEGAKRFTALVTAHLSPKFLSSVDRRPDGWAP